MTDPIEPITRAYEQASDHAAAQWAQQPGIGEPCDPPFHPTHLALCCGWYIGPNAAMLTLRNELARLVAGDPRADVQAAESLHFTFLALTRQAYANVNDLPPRDAIAGPFEAHCRGRTFEVRDLRLVALPNALLLAGVPDVDTLARRDAFAGALMQTPWREHLIARYKPNPVPPPFWHSTLLRYHAGCVPPPVRAFFHDRRAKRYGDIRLPIRLVASNYNWRDVTPLES